MKSAYYDISSIRPSDEDTREAAGYSGKVIDLAEWKEAHQGLWDEEEWEDSSDQEKIRARPLVQDTRTRRWEQAALGLELLASLAIICAMGVLTLQMLRVF